MATVSMSGLDQYEKVFKSLVPPYLAGNVPPVGASQRREYITRFLAQCTPEERDRVIEFTDWRPGRYDGCLMGVVSGFATGDNTRERGRFDRERGQSERDSDPPYTPSSWYHVECCFDKEMMTSNPKVQLDFIRWLKAEASRLNGPIAMERRRLAPQEELVLVEAT